MSGQYAEFGKPKIDELIADLAFYPNGTPTGYLTLSLRNPELLLRELTETASALTTLTQQNELLREANSAYREKEELRDPEKLARKFHALYEQMAPSFGYMTAEATRIFDPDRPNGKLMIAVCRALVQ